MSGVSSRYRIITVDILHDLANFVGDSREFELVDRELWRETIAPPKHSLTSDDCGVTHCK